MSDQKVKSLFSISIDGCQFNTQLHYNINIDHINIRTTFSKRNPKMIVRVCNKCGKEDLIRYSSYKMAKYTNLCNSCSQLGRIYSDKTRKLLQNINKGSNNPAWLGGISFGKYCKLFNELFKQKIRDQYHNKCYFCNKSEIDNKRKLSVHHVNYNKNCLCQKTCEFIPLCQSCHAKTGSKRSYWEDLIMGYLYPKRYFMVEI